MSTDNQLPTYKSHKTVRALKIASIQQAPVQPTVGGGSWLITPANTTFCPFEVPHAYVQKHRPEEGGYWVQYEDGYQSFSPAKAFEEGYEMLSATVATDRPAMTESKDEAHFLQPKITGYRQLNPTEVALMNEGKALAEQCGAFIAKLRKHPNVGGPAPTGDALPALDQRWISIGATDLQTGFMAVTRGIARPTTF